MKSVSDLKLNYVIQKIKSLFSPKDHTHNYAGSSEPGGSATHAIHADTASNATNAISAVNADTAEDLSNKPSMVVRLNKGQDLSNPTKMDPTESSIAIPVTGVLPPSKGGTGVTSYDELRGYLGIPTIHSDMYTGDGASSRTFEFDGIVSLIFIQATKTSMDTFDGVNSGYFITSPNIKEQQRSQSEGFNACVLTNFTFDTEDPFNYKTTFTINTTSGVPENEREWLIMNAENNEYVITAFIQ